LSLALCRRSCTGKQLCAHGRTGCRREEKVPTSRWLHGRAECMGDRTAMTVRAESTRPSQKRGVLAGAGLCSLSSVITHGPLTTSSRLSRPASPVSLSRRRALHHEANQKGRSCMDHHQTTKPDQKNCERSYSTSPRGGACSSSAMAHGRLSSTIRSCDAEFTRA
jgi:hypothetical protein